MEHSSKLGSSIERWKEKLMWSVAENPQKLVRMMVQQMASYWEIESYVAIESGTKMAENCLLSMAW